MKFKSWSIFMLSINATNICPMFLTSKNDLLYLEKNIRLHFYYLLTMREYRDIALASFMPCGKVEAASIAYDYQCLFRSVRNLATNQDKIFALGIPSAGKILILRPSSMK